MNGSKLREKMKEFPRVKLMWGHTPIVYAANISRDLGIDLYIKRDDLSGLAAGGNKTRKLEFIMGEVQRENCDTVITAGAVHSNHALQTAAAAKKLGMDAVLILRGVAENKGNYFLDKLVGADTRIYDIKTSRELKAIAEEIQKELIAEGKKPYFIPVGGSNPVGALGYINATLEIIEQSQGLNLDFDYVINATSSGGTQTGLMLGFRLLAPSLKTLCIGVGDPREELLGDVNDLVEKTLSMLGVEERCLTADDIKAATIDGYGFGGYGTIVSEVIEVIRYVAQKEGIYLDPVYTGKAFFGLIDLVKQGVIEAGSRVLFVHTGGLGSLFHYEEIISEMLK